MPRLHYGFGELKLSGMYLNKTERLYSNFPALVAFLPSATFASNSKNTGQFCYIFKSIL